MKPGPRAILDEPKTRKKAVNMLAKGATATFVARKLGCARSTVSVWANREDARRWIEEETQRYLESLPDALDITRNLIRAGKKESGKLLKKQKGIIDHKVLAFATKEAESMRKSAGITPTHSQSLVLQNIYNDNRGSILSPALESILRAQAAECDVIEVEPEEED